MKVQLSKDVEKSRISKWSDIRKRLTEGRSRWEFLTTTSQVEALHYAKENGWKENKVQVRYTQTVEGYIFQVEPYEKNCGCKGILKYKDFFD